MRHHVMLIVCAMLCAASPDILAQAEARNDINWMPWFEQPQGQPQTRFLGTITPAQFTQLWQPNYHTTNFFAGWNWLAPDREISEVLGMPLHHIGDEWIGDPALRPRYERGHRPR